MLRFVLRVTDISSNEPTETNDEVPGIEPESSAARDGRQVGQARHALRRDVNPRHVQIAPTAAHAHEPEKAPRAASEPLPHPGGPCKREQGRDAGGLHLDHHPVARRERREAHAHARGDELPPV